MVVHRKSDTIINRNVISSKTVVTIYRNKSTRLYQCSIDILLVTYSTPITNSFHRYEVSLAWKMKSENNF